MWNKVGPSIGGNTVVGVNSYVIELDRWGITKGIPSKRIENIDGVDVNCYANEEYTRAYNNVLGFNNATKWANENGYKYVIVPTGEYPICYANVSDDIRLNKIIIEYNHFTLDFNASTLKVIFDSSKRSPYDKEKVGGVYVTRTGPIYGFTSGATITSRNCSYSTIRNLTLIGDKIDRDFLIQEEKAAEHTYGIASGGNGRYNVVENCDVSMFMGDGITCSWGTYVTKAPYELGFQMGDLDASGNFVESTTRVVSTFMTAKPTTPYFMRGLGYTQGLTGLKHKKYDVYLYDKDKVFIVKLPQVFVMREFITTKDTAFYRIVVRETALDPEISGVTLGSWWIAIYEGIFGNHYYVRNNFIHHNHRGGLTPGVNDMYIIGNNFHNNGMQYDYDHDLPGFEQPNGQTFLTRYHINMEDSQSMNMNIIDNRFYGGRIGIAFRGWDYTIRGNEFVDCIGIIAYKIRQVVIDDNTFNNAGFTTFGYNIGENFEQDWIITNNTFDGDFSIVGTLPVANISNNVFKRIFKSDALVRTFKGNTFKLHHDAGFNNQVDIKTIPLIESCVFEKLSTSTIKNSAYFKDTTLVNCRFENIKILTSDITIKDSNIKNCGFGPSASTTLKFVDTKITHEDFALNNNYAINPENSAFINFDNSSTIEMDGCELISTSSQSIFATASLAKKTANLKLKDTKINRMVNTKLGLNLFDGALSLINSTITSELAIPAVTPNATLAHQFIDTTLTNVVVNKKDNDIVYSHLDNHTPLTGSAAPTSVPRVIGQEYYDTTAKKLYKAFGTSDSTDWIIMN